MVRIAIAWLCCALLMWAQTEPEQPRFQLVVVRGDDAQNNIKKGRATKAVVEVRDRNNKPVAGVAVLFAMPESGAGGTFVGGAQTASVTTDSLGQAAITYKPNQVPGKFNIKANVNGTNTNLLIAQTNYAAAGVALSATTITLLAIAGAAGIGLGVGLTRGGGGTTTGTNTVTLTPGGAVVGPPK
jgi:Bacterial Ig-like domain (group 1)